MTKLYRCIKCNTVIPANTVKKLVFCLCGAIGIDGSFSQSRIVGDSRYLSVVEDNETYVYRIKNLESGLYYKPYSWPHKATFNKVGKFYAKKPSLSWVEGMGKCVIEKYKIEQA